MAQKGPKFGGPLIKGFQPALRPKDTIRKEELKENGEKLKGLYKRKFPNGKVPNSKRLEPPGESSPNEWN